MVRVIGKSKPLSMRMCRSITVSFPSVPSPEEGTRGPMGLLTVEDYGRTECDPSEHEKDGLASLCRTWSLGGFCGPG